MWRRLSIAGRWHNKWSLPKKRLRSYACGNDTVRHALSHALDHAVEQSNEHPTMQPSMQSGMQSCMHAVNGTVGNTVGRADSRTAGGTVVSIPNQEKEVFARVFRPADQYPLHHQRIPGDSCLLAVGGQGNSMLRNARQRRLCARSKGTTFTPGICCA